MTVSKRPFACYHCDNKLPFKKALLLSEKSSITCNKCNRENYPSNLTIKYFKFGFVTTYFPGIAVAFYYKNLLAGLGVGILTGALTYLVSVVYAYKTTYFSDETIIR